MGEEGVWVRSVGESEEGLGSKTKSSVLWRDDHNASVCAP